MATLVGPSQSNDLAPVLISGRGSFIGAVFCRCPACGRSVESGSELGMMV